MDIVMTVTGIISGFKVIYDVYRDWRKKRQDRASEKQNLSLQKLLHENGSKIQNEYDLDLRRLGETFKTGDDIVLGKLKDILIQVQAIRITQLSGRRHDDASALIHPHHDYLLRDSKSARNEAITALAQHYQRLSQARPINRQPLALPSTSGSSRSGNCPGQLTWTPYTKSNWIVSLRCETCNWYQAQKMAGIKYVTRDGHTLDERFVLDRFHYHQGPPLRPASIYKCFVCDKLLCANDGFFSNETAQTKVGKHLREHTYNELVGSSSYSPRPYPNNYNKNPSLLSDIVGSLF